MKEIINMVVVLTLICVISALSLALVHGVTKKPIEDAKFEFLKKPGVKAVLTGYDNDPIKDRIAVPLGKDKRGRPVNLLVFPARKNGKTFAVAFEGSGKGYHGDIGVMVGVDVAKDAITGIYVVDQSETPGKGDLILRPSFTDPFKGKSFKKDIEIGDIEALSGATFSTNGVLTAVNKARALYTKYRDQMLKQGG